MQEEKRVDLRHSRVYRIDDEHANNGKPEPPARVLIPREEDLQSANHLAKSRHGFPSFSLIWRQRFGQQEKDV